MDRNRNYGPLAIALVAAVVAAAALAALVTAGPETDYCERAALLREARQPEEALTAYSRAEAGGEPCKDRGQRIAIEAALPRASADFALAATRAEAADREGAIELYVAGLEGNPTSLGALAALEELLAEPKDGGAKGVRSARQGCDWSNRLTAEGVLGSAGVAFATDPVPKRVACAKAKDALAAANQLAETELLAGKNYENEGDEAQARLAYAAALHADAGLGAARIGLERTLGTETPADEVAAWLSDVPGSLEDALKWAIPALVGLLALALALWIGARQLAGAWLGLRRHLETAGESPGLSLLRRVAQPELTVEVFEGGDPEDTGRSFSTLLSQALPEKAGKEAEFAFDRVASGSHADQTAAEQIGELATEIPQTKLLGSVLKIFAKLFRRRTVRIRGYLIPAAGRRGVGVALTLEGSGMRSEVRKTIWEEEFDPQPGGDGAERWLRLVPPATIWARRRLQREMRPDLKLSAEGWRADALLQAGVWWQARGDLGRAEALYADALERDPGLLPALHNLTVVEVHRTQYSQALTRLDRLGRELQDPQARERWPTLETGYLYTRALALSYGAQADGGVDPTTMSKARETATTLVTTLTGEIISRRPAGSAGTPGGEELEHGHAATPEDEDLIELTNAEGPAITLLAALVARADPVAAAKALNCTDRSPMTRKELNEQPNPGPCALIDRYLLNRQSLSRRTRFNLACYYTVLAEAAGADHEGKCLDRALDQLDLALEGGQLTAWANDDPALAFLKGKRQDEFSSALKRHTVSAHLSGDKKDDQATKDSGAPDDRGTLALLLGLITGND